MAAKAVHVLVTMCSITCVLVSVCQIVGRILDSIMAIDPREWELSDCSVSGTDGWLLMVDGLCSFAVAVSKHYGIGGSIDLDSRAYKHLVLE